MIGLVLVTHGQLAEEFRHAVEHVVGPQQNFETVSIGADDDMEQRRRDILDAMAKGEGPREKLVALGYAGWAPGQLEDESGRNGWLTVQTDVDLIFNVPPEARYDAAMHALGVNSANLSEEAGHA